jgi:hypothetical protein
MQTPVREDTEIIASLPYPIAGTSQHLCVVRHSGSERAENLKLFLPWQDLDKTVLAGAFCPGKKVILKTPLPAPHDRIVLPPLIEEQLQAQQVVDDQGKVVGMLLQVPGLFVHANRILDNYLSGNENYNYRQAVDSMVGEAAKLLGSVIKSGILRVRSKPGIMAHALEMDELGADEIGISLQFAEKVLRQVQDKVPLWIADVWDLDGFPVRAVRFPVANRYGVQEMILRVLPGVGHYIACNPFTLAKLWLGDRDGDALFALLRVEDVKEGRIEVAKRPRVAVNQRIPMANTCVTLQGLRNLDLLDCEEKLRKKMLAPDLTTLEARLQYIKDADTRTHVATYTMVFGWWIPRVLAASGRYGPQQAYIKGNDALEWFIEACMDARKGGSPLSDSRFDAHAFMNLLRFGKTRGDDMDFQELARIGVPQYAIETLQEAWEIADGNLPAYCGMSPIYQSLVLGRNQMGRSIPRMLGSLKEMGVKPEEVYTKIIKDLTCVECLSEE